MLNLLEALKARKGYKGSRIRFKTDYIRTLEKGVGSAEKLAKLLEKDSAALDKMLKDAGGQLVWMDNANANPVGSIRLSDGKPVTKGKFTLKAGEAAVLDGKDAVMKFECVLTTGKKDRDGDILHPKGADVDAKAPLLWQHIPMMPIGKLVQVVNQDDNEVRCQFAIANTELGRDAAMLVEFGALRISHGFQPIKFFPLRDADGSELPGWEIEKYHVMEGSVVSIPSNTDAVITAYSRGKLCSPFAKGWGKALFRDRKKVVAGGFKGSIDVNVNLSGLPGQKGKKDDEAPADDGGGDEGGGSGDGGDTAGVTVPFSEIVDAVGKLAADQTLPREARSRLATVQGMLEDIQEQIKESTDALGEAAKEEDLVAIFESTEGLVSDCVGRLEGVKDELARIATIDEMPESATGTLSDISGQVDGIHAALESMCEAAEAAGDGEGEEVPTEGDESDPDLLAEADPDEEADVDTDEEADPDADPDGDSWDDEEDEDEEEKAEASDDEDEDEEVEKAEGDGDEDEDDEKGQGREDDPADDDATPNDDEGRADEGKGTPAEFRKLAARLLGFLLSGKSTDAVLMGHLRDALDEAIAVKRKKAKAKAAAAR